MQSYVYQNCMIFDKVQVVHVTRLQFVEFTEGLCVSC